MATLPGWMLLLGGAALVAMITLVPPWLECRRLSWQTDVMAIQAQQLVSQQTAYKQFLTALREDDPVVVERMAYYHLRLKPVGTSTLDELNQLNAVQAAVYNQLATNDYRSQPAAPIAPLNKVWSTLPTIEDLLAKPIYKPSEFCPTGVVPDTRMVRLATGPARHLMLGLGVLCLFFGLLPASASVMMIANPLTDEADESCDEWDQTGENDAANTTAGARVEPWTAHGQNSHSDPYADVFPDATQTAWALAGTGAVSVSAATLMRQAEQDVLMAELDDQDEDLVVATLVDDEEVLAVELDEELDEVDAELDDESAEVVDEADDEEEGEYDQDEQDDEDAEEDEDLDDEDEEEFDEEEELEDEDEDVEDEEEDDEDEEDEED